jgi:RNA polymerase sigma-70 factor (ECF subfamily)
MTGKTEDIDELILSLLKANDTAASSLLYNAHYKAVYNNVNKIVRDADVSKDITQELFINVWEKRNVLNITTPIRKYLLSAAHNRIINKRRDEARNKRLLEEVIDRSGGTKIIYPADVDYEAIELEKLIKDAIALLPHSLRKNFSMSRYLGMTYREMATHLGVSEKAVEKSMSKALKLLRMLLAPYIKLLLVFTNL